MEQTAVEFLEEKAINGFISREDIQKAKKIEKNYINNLPIIVSEKIPGAWVYIENNTIYVKHKKEIPIGLKPGTKNKPRPPLRTTPLEPVIIKTFKSE